MTITQQGLCQTAQILAFQGYCGTLSILSLSAKWLGAICLFQLSRLAILEHNAPV
jgi:hypothetical protein